MLAAAQGPEARSAAAGHHDGISVSEDRFSCHGISLEYNLADFLWRNSSPLQGLAEIPLDVGNVELQKPCVNPRYKAVEVGGGRNQPGLTGAIGQPTRLIFNAPLAFHNG